MHFEQTSFGAFYLHLYVFFDDFTESSARIYRKLEGAEFVTAGFEHAEVVTYGHALCAL
jgi:hypothetical protein